MPEKATSCVVRTTWKCAVVLEQKLLMQPTNTLKTSQTVTANEHELHLHGLPAKFTETES